MFYFVFLGWNWENLLSYVKLAKTWDLGPTISLSPIFRMKFWKDVVIYEISMKSYLSKRKVSRKKKNF